jgi:hypothetical protein
MKRAWFVALVSLTACYESHARTAGTGFDGDHAADPRMPSGGAPASDAEDPGACTSNADPDQDGLSSASECRIGTDPIRNDSDFDGVDDGTEVGSEDAPLDRDHDGRIDALESAIADNDRDGISDQEQASTEWQVEGGRFVPSVVPSDGSSKARLEVRINGAAALASVAVSASASDAPEAPAGIRVEGTPASAGNIALYDDGTHGDRRAADGIFSRQGFTAQMSIRQDNLVRDSVTFDTLVAEDERGAHERALGYVDDSDHPVLENGLIRLGVVDASVQVDAERIAPFVQATKHLLNIASGRLGTLLRAALIDGDTDVSPLSRAVFQQASHDADFIVALAAEDVFSDFSGRPFRVSNDVSGLGLDITDPDERWGWTRRLRDFAVINFDAHGPISHEIMHRWGMYWPSSLGFDYGDDAYSRSHWGWANANGVLGGFDPATLTDHGDGTVSVDIFSFEGHYGTERPFSKLELYLMGLIDADDVGDIQFLRNFQAFEREGHRLTADAEIETLRMSDVVAAEGERRPGVAESQKDFDAIFVVFSDTLLDRDELAFFESWAAAYGDANAVGDLSFEQATSGLARMNTRILR